jgi:hypothetical protein
MSRDEDDGGKEDRDDFADWKSNLDADDDDDNADDGRRAVGDGEASEPLLLRCNAPTEPALAE